MEETDSQTLRFLLVSLALKSSVNYGSLGKD